MQFAWSFLAFFTCYCIHGTTSQGSVFDLVAISNTTDVIIGQSAVLSCVAFHEFNVSVTITWIKNESVISNSITTNITERESRIGGRNFILSFLHLCDVQPSTAGIYTCSVSNDVFADSDTVELNLVVLDFAFSEISYNVTEGESQVTICLSEVSGDVPGENVTVEVKTLNGTAIAGVNYRHTTSILVFSSTSGSTICFDIPIYFTNEREEIRTFTVQASSKHAAVSTSMMLEAFVNIEPYFRTAFDIVAITNETTINEGESTELVCTVFYQRDANITITWLRAGVPVMNLSDSAIFERDRTHEGRQFRLLHLQLCNVMQSAVYTCFVSNGTGTKQNTVLLRVNTNEQAFEIVRTSNATQASTGESVILTCVVFYERLTNLSSIAWYKDNQKLSNTSSTTIREFDEELEGRLFRHSMLYLCDLEMSSSGNYMCSVSNGSVTIHGQVELLVIPADELTEEDTFEVFEVVAISNDTQSISGQSVVLSCVVFHQRNANLLTIVWSKGDEDISNTSSMTIRERDEAIGGRLFRHSMLYLCNLEVSSSGNYACSVSNETHTEYEEVELLVNQAMTFNGTIEKIRFFPSVIKVGENVSLVCEASVDQSSKISWTYDGQDIVSSNSSLILEDYSSSNGIGRKSSSLWLYDIQCHQSGLYICSVSNDSSSTVLTVTGNIMVNLTPENAELELGENLTLVCTINGQLNGEVNVTWTKDNVEVMSSQEKFVKGKTLTSSHILSNFTMDDEGTFSCSVLQNNCTSSSSAGVFLQQIDNKTASGLSDGEVAGVAVAAVVAAAAVTTVAAGASVAAIKVATKVVKKPPTDALSSIEKGGQSEKNTGKYKSKLKKKCMNCFKKLIAKLKRALCRKRRQNAKAKRKAAAKGKKKEKKKVQAEDHINGKQGEIKKIDDTPESDKVAKPHTKKKSGAVKSDHAASKITKPTTTKSKKRKSEAIKLEMEENTGERDTPATTGRQNVGKVKSKPTKSSHKKKTKSGAGNEYVDSKESTSVDKPKVGKSHKSSNSKLKKPDSSKKVKQDALELDHVYENPNVTSPSKVSEQGHIYDTVA